MRTLEPQVAVPERFRASCLASDSMGRAVRISGPVSGGMYQVESVDIDSAVAGESTAVGVIVSKPTSMTCVVQTSGVLLGVISGQAEGRKLFVQTDATLSTAVPGRPTSGRRTIQALAMTISSDAAIIGQWLRARIVPE